MLRLARVLVGAGASYAQLAWWGLVSPRLPNSSPLVVLQAVVRSDAGILLAIREELRGWELPGGGLEPDESPTDALYREVREETGAQIHVDRHVGDYVRTGFLPHTAKVYLCRYTGGPLRTNSETRDLRWFQPDALPETLFPWYREPIAHALEDRAPPASVQEHLGLSSILDGLRIDLRMRYSDDRSS